MNVLIIDQCSKAKTHPEGFAPYDEAGIDNSTKQELLEAEGVPAKKARDLYAGRQQSYITQAAEKLREVGDSVDRYFISAGFGLVEEDEHLPPYNVTFANYSSAEIQERANSLQIEESLLDVISDEYDIVFFALGNDYYQSFELSAIVAEIPSDTLVVAFNQESITAGFENAISLPARTKEAKEHGTIVVALKGKYLQNFADYRSHGKTVDSITDLEKYCTTEYTTQSGLNDFDN